MVNRLTEIYIWERWLIINCLRTHMSCSERWPIIPVSLLCRLSYAIYSWLFSGVHIDLKCNEQIHTKMSQQSHSICFTSSSVMVFTENICQKLSIIDTPRNYSGQAGTLGGHSSRLVWQSHSALSCSYYYSVIRIIHLNLHLFLWWLGWGARYTEWMK